MAHPRLPQGGPVPWRGDGPPPLGLPPLDRVAGQPHRAQRVAVPRQPRVRPAHSSAFHPAPPSQGTAAATHFAVLVQPQTFAAETTQATVVALDANNRPTANYTGTVSLSSSDAGATLPGNYTFTAADRGTHTFDVTFAATGSDSLTATDSGNAAVAGTGTVSVAATQVATHLAVLSRPDFRAGSAAPLVVAVEDANNRPVQNYTGTVQVTSSDANATLPGNYTFTAADRGVHAFALTLATSGSQTVTATDTGNATLAATANVEVGAGGFLPGGPGGPGCPAGLGNGTTAGTGNGTTGNTTAALAPAAPPHPRGTRRSVWGPVRPVQTASCRRPEARAGSAGRIQS